MITAQLALDANREIFAVPGSCLEKYYTGCNDLIQQGAKPIWEAKHIIEEIEYL